MNKQFLPATLAAALIAAVASPASAQAIEGKAAFAKLKELAGTWSGPIGSATGPAAKVRYEVISAGSVVMETQFPGEPHEMRSMYHLDKGDLILTHYCSGGNQPRMRLSKTASTEDALIFDFDGGTDFDVKVDSHVHNGEIRFRPDGRLDANWTAWDKGQPSGTNRFALSRQK